jgi:hypothetical protein
MYNSPRTTRVTRLFCALAGLCFALFTAPAFGASISIFPTSINYGNNAVNSAPSSNVVLKNTSNKFVRISSASITGPFTFSGIRSRMYLWAGQSVTIQVKFVPKNAGSFKGALNISTQNGDAVTVALSGSAGAAAAMSISPTSINYGNNPVNSGPYQYVTLSNTGSGTVNISSVSITGAFTFSGITYPMSLAAGTSISFQVKFIPKTTGNFTGTLSVFAQNAATAQVALSGSANSATALTISPSSFSFGNVTVGNTSTKSVTFAAGSSAVTISGATTTNPEFTLSGVTFPTTIQAGQSISAGVNFKPSSSGSASTQFSISSNAANSPGVVTATGSGVAVTQHAVSLTWSPSTSNVAGYNVYRGTASGGPYSKLNGSAVVTTSYSDTSVKSGSTYFYVTTAVNSAGAESTKSNEVRTVIPTP